MKRTRFINGRLVGQRESRAAALTIDGALIASDQSTSADLDIDLEGGFLLPGFIDTQVNGGGGVLFNDSPTVASIAQIGEAHLPFGTTTFLPTLISDDLDKVDAAMRATEQAIAQGVPGVVGIHLEGPFLNAARKGTHDPQKFRRLDDGAIALLTSLKLGRTLVTLAPENCAPDDIRRLTEAGVIVAAGHSDADYATMKAAFAMGVTGVTHLYNAMSPFNHRAPGVVGATLEDQHVYAGVIVDGRHVDPVALRIAMAARPRDRFMLVTDAMPTVGSLSKTFILQGKTIRVEDGVCIGEGGVLAGSDLDMATAVRNAVNMVGLSLAEAAIMAASAPAAFMGLTDRGALGPGMRADLVWLDHELKPRGVWIGGEHHPAMTAA
ncbi:N-acetylglucosamine-6-phosphate deacetylase [Sphingobium aromaticiconvertens]|uniref:N-acetylglucosamine-6-phosphate deacetylase n=1 Tax=Sphingobium aromaticiconvertens TaxID=365341 RepID=UPI0030190839